MFDNAGREPQLCYVPLCNLEFRLNLSRKKRMEEEEAEMKRKATDAAYQG